MSYAISRRQPGERRSFSPAAVLFFVFFPVVSACFAFILFHAAPCMAEEKLFLRIYDQRAGTLYAETPVRENSRLVFGWIHSLEKIPWNEYYHVDEKRNLVLDAITFPAFGAGIPEDKGRVCYVRDGLIHMEEIGQEFSELVWLNSHTATRDITLDGAPVTSGSALPHHAGIRMLIEKGESNGTP